MDTEVWLAIFAIVKKTWDNVTGGRVESMCRLTHVIPSVPIKDRIIGGPLVILNACLSLSWPDNSFRPRNQVAQLKMASFCQSAHSG